MRSAVIGVYLDCDNGGRVLPGILRYHWFGAGMVAFFRYCVVGSGTVVLGVSGCGLVFSASVWQIVPRFLVEGA